MPRDRHAWRMIFEFTVILWACVSGGCLKSTMLRPANEPAAALAPATVSSSDEKTATHAPSGAQPANPAANQPPLESPMPPQALTDDRVLPSAGAPAMSALTTQVEVPSSAPVAETPPSDPPVAAPDRTEADATKMPLLDSAIERVAVNTREQVDTFEPEKAPSEPDSNHAEGLASSTPAIVPSSLAPPPPPPPALRPEAIEPTPSLLSRPNILDETPVSTDVPSLPRDDTSAVVTKPAPPMETVDQAGPGAKPQAEPQGLPSGVAESRDEPRPAAVADDPDPLVIGKLRLCRKVSGFGSFEPLGESPIKAGQKVLVYCEMTGMHSEARESAYVSRLASRIDVSSAETGAVVWTREHGPAEDVCGSRRRDFYVNYRVDLPRTLSPGSYLLRLTQTDLIANRSTSAELPINIVAGD